MTIVGSGRIPKATTIKVSNPSQVRLLRTDLGGRRVLAAFFMRPKDLAPRTKSKPALADIGGLVNDLPKSQLPIAPFKAWSSPGMKTGLRNQSIGRKISLVPFRAAETDQTPFQLANVSETSTISSKR
jgi:hypothetical protein